MPERRIRVILIEDHGVVREGLKLILQGTDDIEVVGEAADGESGLRLFTRLAVDDPDADGGIDVVVTDLGLPDIGGLEVTRRIKAARPDMPVLILTMHTDDDHIRGMLELGADGYVLKQSAVQEFAEAIRTVARGETALHPTIARRIMKQLQQGRERERRTDLLTERERSVLALLADGATSKEIARQLGLSTKTIENHRARILEKLGVSNTAAAIGLAYQHGLIGQPHS